MTAITTRAGKGLPLTNVEVDANFTNLNTGKLEKASNLSDLENTATARSNLGLGNVNNTSDANKPVSTAQQTALNLKQNAATAVTKDSATGMANIPAGTSAQRPASPPFGAQRANSTTGAMEWWNGAEWAPMGGNDGFRNKIINGAFGINQRVYVSGAATTAGQYTLDRWKVTSTSGITFSTVNNKTTVTIPAGQTLQQVIEGLDLATGVYVLSWEGTAQGRIGAGSYGASGSVKASITGGTNTTIEFNTGTVANVQLEAGSIATPFEHRPNPVELAMCQRYLEVGQSVMLGAACTNMCMSVHFKQNKRVAPTVFRQNDWFSSNTNGSVISSPTPEGFSFINSTTNATGVGGSWIAWAEL